MIYKIVYDCELVRPGCVLLQAAGGGTVPRDLFLELFDNAAWLLAPTKDMKLYGASLRELEVLSSKTKKHLVEFNRRKRGRKR